MTHYPHHPLLSLVGWAVIFLLISGSPVAYIVDRIFEISQRAGKVTLVTIVPAWLVIWVQGTQLMARHGELQREAAAEANCLGYSEYGFPDRCREVLMGPETVPDGFFVWIPLLLATGVVGLAVITLDSWDGWNIRGRVEVLR